VTLALVLFAASSASSLAHRRDEYLQAARLAIDPDRIELELDLTPGIAVARDVVERIDVDRNRSISPGEAQSYAGLVLKDVALELDGVALRLDLAGQDSPAVDAMLAGEGTLRVRAAAETSHVTAGRHRLRYRNTHRPDIAVYLANALVPASDRIAITNQIRDVNQREFTVDYVVGRGSARTLGYVTAGAIAFAFIALATARWRSARSGPAPEREHHRRQDAGE
jgi:hypothetical protein